MTAGDLLFVAVPFEEGNVSKRDSRSSELCANCSTQELFFVKDPYLGNIARIDPERHRFSNVGRQCRRDVAKVLEVDSIRTHLTGRAQRMLGGTLRRCKPEGVRTDHWGMIYQETLKFRGLGQWRRVESRPVVAADHAANGTSFSFSAFMAGYQRRNVSRNSLLSTCARTCSKR